MPFKSKAQQRACYAKDDPNWNCEEWSEHTDQDSLPEKKKESSAHQFGQLVAEKLAQWPAAFPAGASGSLKPPKPPKIGAEPQPGRGPLKPGVKPKLPAQTPQLKTWAQNLGRGQKLTPHSEYSGSAAPAYKRISKAFISGEIPPGKLGKGYRPLKVYLHSGGSGARQHMLNDLMRQGWRPQYISPAAQHLLNQRIQTAPPEKVLATEGLNWHRYGERPHYLRPRTAPKIHARPGQTALPATLPNSIAMGLPSVYNHEVAEHGAQQLPLGTKGEMPYAKRMANMSALNAAAEIPAVLGDLVFSGETARREMGQEPDHFVNYPSGAGHDLGWMIRQAKKHGYFGGRSMTDLLGTPEGLSYLRWITEGPETPYAKGKKPLIEPWNDPDLHVKQQSREEELMEKKSIGPASPGFGLTDSSLSRGPMQSLGRRVGQSGLVPRTNIGPLSAQLPGKSFSPQFESPTVGVYDSPHWGQPGSQPFSFTTRGPQSAMPAVEEQPYVPTDRPVAPRAPTEGPPPPRTFPGGAAPTTNVGGAVPRQVAGPQPPREPVTGPNRVLGEAILPGQSRYDYGTRFENGDERFFSDYDIQVLGHRLANAEANPKPDPTISSPPPPTPKQMAPPEIPQEPIPPVAAHAAPSGLSRRDEIVEGMHNAATQARIANEGGPTRFRTRYKLNPMTGKREWSVEEIPSMAKTSAAHGEAYKLGAKLRQEKEGIWPFGGGKDKSPQPPTITDPESGGQYLTPPDDLGEDEYLDLIFGDLARNEMAEFMAQNPGATFEDYLASPAGQSWFADEEKQGAYKLGQKVAGLKLAQEDADVQKVEYTPGENVLSALLAGSTLGGTAGALVGHGRGNMAEGLGRGILRGGSTGAGAALGHWLGRHFGGDLSGLAGLGLGGLGGYLGSGLLLGRPSGG